MKLHGPSPALVVSIIALVVALSGSAVAASYVISTSSQLKNGVVVGPKIANGTIAGTKLKNGTITAKQIKAGLIPKTAAAATPTTATESFRKDGPNAPDGAAAVVATLNLPAGAYSISAKTNLTPTPNSGSGTVGGVVDPQATQIGTCQLDAAGDVDSAAGTLGGPGTQTPANLRMQITRTLASAGTITVKCSVSSGGAWHASDTSIIALAVGATTRTASG